MKITNSILSIVLTVTVSFTDECFVRGQSNSKSILPGDDSTFIGHPAAQQNDSTCTNDWNYRIVKVKSGDVAWCKWLDTIEEEKRNVWCDTWNNGRLVKEACARSCGACDPPAQGPKKGIIINRHQDDKNVNHFEDSASWFYNYSQMALPWEGEWADENGIEFVPMIAKKYLRNQDKSTKCYFDNSNPKFPLCTKEDAINTIRASIRERSNGICPRYLIGFNEQYNDAPPIDLTPYEAALYWGRYVQPAAVANGLILVSPTTADSKAAVTWFAKFLQRCYDRRYDRTDPCDVDLIKRIAVHEYKCKNYEIENSYGGPSSDLIIKLGQKLGNYGGKSDWLNYIRSRKLWITETNCFWESTTPHLDSKEQCLRITGQKWQTHGLGSIAKFEKMDNIERYAWWSTGNEQIKPNYLTYRGGQLTPIGKAYLNPGNPIVDCEFPGVKISAENAILSGSAEKFTCKGTGTRMVRNIGLVRGRVGTMTFTVEVPSPGDYAINVSYVTETTRDLSVSINNGDPEFIPFLGTGHWCFDETASSTVLPIEVTGLNQGTNTVTFGNLMDKFHAPIVEWISVVV